MGNKKEATMNENGLFNYWDNNICWWMSLRENFNESSILSKWLSSITSTNSFKKYLVFPTGWTEIVKSVLEAQVLNRNVAKDSRIAYPIDFSDFLFPFYTFPKIKECTHSLTFTCALNQWLNRVTDEKNCINRII